VIFFGYSVYNSKLGPRKIAGETGWSRALKIARVVWIVFGSLGIVIGIAGFVLAWSLGALLNLVAQVSDHTHARHLMMESPSDADK
jgi:hypothetical protein